MNSTGNQYHFVGIGGSGMSGLAKIMLAQGNKISGSDLHGNEEVQKLRQSGATIHIGHNAKLINNSLDGVIVSSAIDDQNLEVRAAQRLNLPVIKRLHALASLLPPYRSIGISGTHGKTTTTAMTATILEYAGRSPSYLVGAHCPGLGNHSNLGCGDDFVTEVDESDGLFVSLNPTIGVLNNIGRDHLNTYASLSAIKKSFRQYMLQSSQAVLAIDNLHVRELSKEVPNALTVGIHPQANLRASKIVHYRFQTTFELLYNQERICLVDLPAPGKHNVRNALCAIGAAFLAGVDFADSRSALERFRLPSRRFQLLEENGVTVVDDYAHLPEEIEATLEAIRCGWRNRRVVAIFQPHRYTRTQAIHAEFGAAFGEADTVLVTSIYPACEPPIPGVTSRVIIDSIAKQSDAEVHSIKSKANAVSFLKRYIEPGDFIISFGAGDIWTVTEELSCFLEEGQFCTTTV